MNAMFTNLLTRCRSALSLRSVMQGALVALFVFAFTFSVSTKASAAISCPAGTCPDGYQFGAGSWEGTRCSDRYDEACRDHQLPTGNPSSNVCPNDSSKPVKLYKKFVCPNGCVYGVESGVGAYRCYVAAGESTSPLTLGENECGQVDVFTDNGAFCGYSAYTCNQARCQSSTPAPTTPPTAPPAGGATPVPQPVCGYKCATEEFCDSALVYLVPKYTSDAVKYAVLDKITIGTTTLQEDSASLTYYNSWLSYGPAAGYLDGQTKISYASAIPNGTATWVAFYVNAPSFTVFTDKGPNRSGYNVFINGVQVSTGLDNLNQATTYGAFQTTINIPGYNADKYTCAYVGPNRDDRQCRLTSDPRSATCTPGAATPSPSPAALACYGVSRDNPAPVKGSQVTYMMNPVPTDVLNGRTATYEGRCTYQAQVGPTEGTTGTINLVPVSAGASKFQPLSVQFDRASYTCTFRYCLSDGQCIPWGTIPAATAVPGT